jgi:Adenylate and Guanylate cyclase catalytic domain/AAA ATPase domain
MQHLLNRYRETSAAIVARYDGHVAQYLGDGIMAYFGYPHAFEYAAERAVRAGLEIVRAVAHLSRPDGMPLQTRLGIASGLVASASASGSGDQTVVGDTPNLANRLQALAEPGSVLVSEATRQLTGNFFEYAPHGEHALKGFSPAQPAWTALRERTLQTRFAAQSALSAPMVGRERELAFLLDSWQRASRGNGHLVLVGGEAGMGKSRMLEALATAVQAGAARLLRCQCSPYHRNSALYPFA